MVDDKMLPLREIIKSEYTKCVQDIVYFLKKYVMIQHPVRGRIPFLLYEFQEDVLESLADNDYTVILKARQLGLTTLIAGYVLWLMIFNEDKNVLVISKDQASAKNLVTKVRFANTHLPGWLRMEAIEDNKLSLKLKNMSEIKASASTRYAGRSEALSLLILDEAAFMDKIDDIWASSQQTLATGGRAIILSTPNGVGNFFHKQWVEAVEGTSGFVPIKLHWSVHPEREQDWRDAQTLKLGPKLSAQECDTSFITSGDSVIPGPTIKYYEEEFKEEPIEKRGMDGNYWIWEPPDYNKPYIVVADVARGDGADYSVFHVLDIENAVQVAEYRGKVDTETFGHNLVAVAQEYNSALLVIENSGVGWSVVQKAIDKKYPNLFYMSNDMKYVDVENQITNKHYKEDKKLVAGFTTSSRTRPLIVSKLDEYVRDHSILIRSSRMIGEMWTFIWKNSRPEAMHGYNDDLIMAMAIGLWVRDTALKLRYEGIELTKMAIDLMDTSLNRYDGVYNSNAGLRKNPYEMIIQGNKESLEWLL